MNRSFLMRKLKDNVKPALVASLAFGLLSSCNRGYGCPTNFSFDEAWQIVANLVLAML